MRTFKPALARDYDVFFAAIGLLCGGILFFQGWRLDPILQFGQFLLAGTTVFFAYESVRLRGVAADQARRSSYFDDEPEPSIPNGGSRGGWEDNYEQFDEPLSRRRRFSPQDRVDNDRSEEDFYRPRRTSRAAIPEQAASRNRRSRTREDSFEDGSERSRRMARFSREDEKDNSPSFGERRNQRQDQRRGSRPSINEQNRSRREAFQNDERNENVGGYSLSARRSGTSKGSSFRSKAEDVAFSPSRPASKGSTRSTRSSEGLRTSSSEKSSDRKTPRSSRPRDNDSRFDD